MCSNLINNRSTDIKTIMKGLEKCRFSKDALCDSWKWSVLSVSNTQFPAFTVFGHLFDVTFNPDP